MSNKLLSTIGAVAVVVAVYLTWAVRTGVKGFYSNQYSTISASVTSRQVHADWMKRQGANLDAIYGADAIVNTSKQGTLADLIIRERRGTVKSIAMPYSSANTVIINLDKYNKAVVDSAKIDAVISEIEPYNTNDYASFYTTIRSVNTWAKANRIMPCVYMGWPSDAAWDSIVVNADRIYLHCYRPSNRMSGINQYGYVLSRLNMVTPKAKTRKKKMSIVLIYSCEPKRVINGVEQPEYGYTYFQTTSWSDAYKAYLETYNASATADMKTWLSQDGWMIFVSEYAKQIKP